MEKSWNTYKERIKPSDIPFEYHLEGFDNLDDFFNFFQYFLTIAKNNNVENFNIYDPMDQDGDNILHIAVINNKYLQQAFKLSPYELFNMKNNAGFTPLYLAAVNYDKDPQNYRYFIVSLAINDANPNIPYKEGNTPLHIAAQKHSIDLVKTLDKYGANINAKNNAGVKHQEIFGRRL